jgi:hypothetical protein
MVRCEGAASCPPADLVDEDGDRDPAAGRIECILDWATHRTYRSGKNPASWEGNLKHELPPSPTKLKKRKRRHHPALPYLRIGTFMAELRSAFQFELWNGAF